VAVASVFDFTPFRAAWRYSRPEGALMGIVAAITVVLGVAWALAVGVAASIALLLQRTARPHVALIGRVPGTEHYRNVGRHQVELTPGVLGLRIDESLLFTNARQLADVVQQQVASHPDTQRVVLLMSPVNGIDFSGLARCTSCCVRRASGWTSARSRVRCSTRCATAAGLRGSTAACS
jgi:SulP family sulfate permease